MILKNIKLRNELKKHLKKTEIKDVLVFGSVIRGKEQPNDIDILVIFSRKVIKEEEYLLRKILEKYSENISIVSKTEKTILEDSFDAREGILFEATSLITKKNLAQMYGFVSFGMFKYSFTNWTKLQKTKFYYALNGRGSTEGIFQKLECIKLSDNLMLVPLNKIEKFRDFLDAWNLNYKYVPTIIPQRMGKKKILS